MIIAANFKTNHTRESTKEYLQTLIKYATTHQIRIYPPFTAFLHVKDLPSNIKLGAQNFYPINNGSCTGEIGAEQLDEFALQSVLIGHSERRHTLKECDSLIAKKFHFAKEHHWEIIYCTGEPISIREKGKEALFAYLKNQLKTIDLTYKNLIIAYEPVWAIGTGVVANTRDIQEALDFLREQTQAPLLYGGSVKSNNVADTFALKNCNGVLVGTASWNVDEFIKIINIAE